MALEQLHESADKISQKTHTLRRAYASLIEELEAISWYDQRIDAADDEELKAILIHNRDEEMEHACMMLEWLRRHTEGWQEKLQLYLNSEGPVTELEKKNDL